MRNSSRSRTDFVGVDHVQVPHAKSGAHLDPEMATSSLLRLLACVGVASASYLTPANFAPPARPRARRAVCEETLPDAASEAIPPAKMAEAWRRDEA